MLRLALSLTVWLLLIPSVLPKSYHASRFDVDLDVEAGGDLSVTETVVFQFEDGPFTYVFREIPLGESDGLDRFQGFMDGEELRVGDGEPAGLELQRRSNSIRLIWHFPPIPSGSHTLVVKYRARGAVRRENGQDLLLWKAIPPDHAYRIESGRITIAYPAAARLAGEPGANRRTTIRASGSTISYEAGQLNKDRGVTINVPFARGSILTAPPLWQQEAERRSSELSQAVATATAIVGPLLLVGILMIVRLRFAIAVPKGVGPSVATSPPDDLPPALVGAIRGSWSDWRVALAALIDLAQKGFLEIEAEPKRWWTSRQFTLRRKADPGRLNHIEEVLLRLVFGSSQPYAGEVQLRKAQRQLRRHWRQFTTGLREAAEEAGFIDAERQRTRRKWIGWGVALVCLAEFGTAAILLAVAPQSQLLPIVMTVAVGIAVFILGLLVLILGATLTRLTDAALNRKQRWDAFRKHLRQMASKKGPLQPEWLASYLPYAIVFGLGNQWAKAFKDRGMPAHLAWLVGADQFDGSEVAALVAVLSSSGAGHSSRGGGSGGAGGGGGGGSSGAG